MSKTALRTCSKLACFKNWRIYNNRLLCIKRHCSYESNCTSACNTTSSTDGGSGGQVQGSLYDMRKYSHNLPGNNVNPPFDILDNIPSGVFRTTTGEVIGPQAGKCAYYRNPEYYSFHHMSFFDMHMAMRPYRKPQLQTGRKPTII